MRYECAFRHPTTGARRTIIVNLTDEEIARLERTPGNASELIQGAAKRTARDMYPPIDFVCESARAFRWNGAMKFEMAIVNPKSNEEREIIVSLSAQQVAEAKTSDQPLLFVQQIARSEMPDGFMPIGAGVVPLHASRPSLRVVH